MPYPKTRRARPARSRHTALLASLLLAVGALAGVNPRPSARQLTRLP